MITVGSLFAGIGGIELGLERTGGFRTIWSVEIDDYANAVRRKHWPDVPQYGDIREFPPEGIERPDLITAGFPCTDLSCAGKQAGLGRETRSGLFWEAVRVARALRPRWVLLENVGALLSGARGAWMRSVLWALAEVGYDAEWRTLRASDFGFPHRRERVFILAHCQGINVQRPGAEGQGQAGGPGGQLADCVRERSQGDRATGQADRGPGEPCAGDVGDAADVKPKREQATVETGKESGVGRSIPRVPPGPGDADGWRYVLANWPWLAPAIEPGVCRMADGISVAVDRHRRKRLKALGNAVVPACAEWIGNRLLDQFRGVTKMVESGRSDHADR